MSKNPNKQPPGWTAKREADMKRQGGKMLKPKTPTTGFARPRPPEKN